MMVALFIVIIYCLNGLSELPMSEVPRRKRTMVRNQHQFMEWLMNHPDYDTAFLTCWRWHVSKY